MKPRQLAVVLVPLTLVVALGVAIMAAHRTTDAEPIYTPADVQTGAMYHPGDWADRTIRVRGRTESPLTMMGPGRSVFSLIDPNTDSRGRTYELDVQPGPQDPLLAALRRIPGLRAMVPPPQRIAPLFNLTTYRIRLQPLSGNCTPSPCLVAVLVDAAP